MYVGSVGLPSVVVFLSYIGWVCWSVNLSRLVGSNIWDGVLVGMSTQIGRLVFQFLNLICRLVHWPVCLICRPVHVSFLLGQARKIGLYMLVAWLGQTR